MKLLKKSSFVESTYLSNKSSTIKKYSGSNSASEFNCLALLSFDALLIAVATRSTVGTESQPERRLKAK